MEPDLNRLLNIDINHTQDCLQKILAEMEKSAVSSDVLEEGLRASHTLKALAAIKDLAHLEEYAAQLEQLFIYAKQLQPAEVYNHLNSQLKIIQRDFKEACNLVKEENQKSPVPRKLAKAVEILHQLDRKHRQTSFNKHVEQLNNNEISIEALFKSFVPWIHRAAETTNKDIQIDFQIPQHIALQTTALPPLQTILVHLLRNALFHGIEHSSERKAAGKSSRGTIQFKAKVYDDLLILAVADDGKGISRTSSLSAVGFNSTSAAVFLEKEPILENTESSALKTSIYSVGNLQTGLGIGLHIVRSQLKELEGELDLKSIPGTGTSAIIRIPLKTLKYRTGNV